MLVSSYHASYHCVGLKLSDKKKLLSAGQKRRLDNGGETSYSSMDETSSNKTNTDPTTCNTTDNSPSSDSDQWYVYIL